MMRTMTIGMAIVALMLVAGCKETGQSTEKTRSTAQTEGKSLKFIAPAGVTLARGGTADVTIKLERKNFDDQVTVKFGDLPKGVHVVGASGLNVNTGLVHIDLGHEAPPIAGDGAIYTLKADADAPLVADSEMQLTAKGPDGQPVKTSLKVTVIEKP
jgi:hypothetical protein